MSTKLVINRDSGNCEKLNTAALFERFGEDCEAEFINSHTDWNADNFDTIVVCGGDGTLTNAVAKCTGKRLIYVPCGTLNETARTEKRLSSICKVNGKPFSYVCATGSFTEIGYSAKTDAKKHRKNLAYLQQVFKNYRCHEIPAEIDIDGRKIKGDYTLLMVLKSHRCFGFRFNRDYKHTGKPYLLAINSLGADEFCNRVKMFFPFFRVFFCGIKPNVTKKWALLPFDNLTITLETPRNFCVDGEKRTFGGRLHFRAEKINPPIEILSDATLTNRKPRCRKFIEKVPSDNK